MNKIDDTKKLPRMARGRRNRFFEAEGVDDLISMVLELTAEVSVLRERQYALEKVLEAHNLPVQDAVANWAPDETDDAILVADRQRLIATVLRTLDVESKGKQASTTVMPHEATTSSAA